MKFARRRATDDALPEAGASPPAPEGPPRGRPLAAYAGIVDGEALWVAVEARLGTLAVRPAGGGDVIVLSDDSADDQPAYTAARLDLLGLLAAADTNDSTDTSASTTYDVVLVSSSRAAVVLWTPPLPATTPRTARDGVTRFALHRGPEGALQVTRTRLPAAATVRSVRVEPGAAHLTLVGGGATLAALDEDGGLVASWPVIDQTAVLSLEALDGLEPQPLRLVSGEPGAWRPIRRRGNDHPDPGKAAAMPALFAPDLDDPRARLRWTPQALLQLRILKSGADPTQESAHEPAQESARDAGPEADA